MRLAVAVALLVSFGAVYAVAVGAVNAEPDPATITLTVQEYQALARQAAERDVYARRWAQERRNAVARAHTIRRLRAANRETLAVPAWGLAGAFRCLKQFEGAWTSNTGNGYYGGLQMDRSFQRAYGREFYAAWGTADQWPPFVQVAVAMRAHLSGRGFSPWPNTRRKCGI